MTLGKLANSGLVCFYIGIKKKLKRKRKRLKVTAPPNSQGYLECLKSFVWSLLSNTKSQTNIKFM